MRAEYDLSKGERRALIPQKGRTCISIFIDNTVLDAFRARAQKAGTGCQTMINDALRSRLSERHQPVIQTLLRQVLREEVPVYLRTRSTRSRRGARKRATRSPDCAGSRSPGITTASAFDTLRGTGRRGP